MNRLAASRFLAVALVCLAAASTFANATTPHTLILDDFESAASGVVEVDGALAPSFTAGESRWTVHSGRVATDGSDLGNYHPAPGQLNFAPSDTVDTHVSIELAGAEPGPASIEFQLRQSNRSAANSSFRLIVTDTTGRTYTVGMSPNAGQFGRSGFMFLEGGGRAMDDASLTVHRQSVRLEFDPESGFALYSSEYPDPVLTFPNKHDSKQIAAFGLMSKGAISWFVDDLTVVANASPGLDAQRMHEALRSFYGVRSPHPDWRNSLQHEPDGCAPITLAEDYVARYPIVIPERPALQTVAAADELKLWLRVITGAEFRVVREDQLQSPEKVISLGDTERYRSAGFETVDLKQDGYRLALHEGNLFIAGGSRRGVVNGVMALLEEDLGCRWYQPEKEATVVPVEPSLTVHPTCRVFVSPYDKLRKIDYSDVQNNDWRQRNRVRMGRWHGFYAHTYNSLMPPEKYFEQHPEYYSEINGQRTKSQLCPMHPDVQRIVLDKVRENLRSDPTVEYVDVSPNDGRGYCRCRLCTEVIEREGTMMGPLLVLVNHVADGIRDEYPDVLVTTLSYLDTVVPTRTFGPAPNVLLWMANDRHAWGFQDMFVWETDQSAKAMKAWEDRWQAPKMIWDYPSEYHGSTINFSLPVIAGNLQWYTEHGADGIYFQTLHNPNYGFPQAYQRSWIFAKLAWDPTLDTQALVRDFNYGFYGEAAPHMQSYHELLWETWRQWHADVVESTQLPWKVEGARKIKKNPGRVSVEGNASFWDQAEKHLAAAKKSVAGRPVFERRVDVARIPLLYRELEKGPADDAAAYRSLIDEFERIARTSRVLIVERNVGPPTSEDLSEKLDYWRKLTEPLPNIPYIELSNTWKFEPDPLDIGLKERWYEPGYSDLAWSSIETGSWIKQGHEGLDLAWYRQSFSVTDAMLRDENLWMLFGGVDETAEVYLNGKLVFEHTEASTGLTRQKLWNRAFVFNAKPHLHAGDNTLAVRVTRTASQAGIWIPVRFILQEARPDAQEMTDAIEEMLVIKRVRE